MKRYLTNEKQYHVLVTILTDGQENSSKEYSGKQIGNIVKELQKNRWTFTYIGTGHDIQEASNAISIKNIMHFDREESSVKEMFLKETYARQAFCENIKEGKSTETDFYQ